MSAAPRQYGAIVALMAANDIKDDAIRAKMDSHDILEMKHREAGRALDARRDSLHTELRANAADKRAIQAEKVARCAQNNRDSIYQTGEA